MSSSPLKGLKVLDMTRVLAGPACAMTLGDLGANIIKVERPDGGDETRGWGPPFDELGESAYFLSTNRNKRSLTADFAIKADVRLLHDLAVEADVVIENFLPDALPRRGIHPESILTQNSRMIWCSIHGYANDHNRPGYDFALQAESGWMSITGEPDGEPMKTAVALIDVLAGKDAAIAILAALIGGRDGTAAQRHLHITLAGSAASALMNVAQNTLVSGLAPRRWGNAHANLVPYQLFQTADRPLVIAVGSDAQWRTLTTLLANPALEADSTLATNAGRVINRSRCVDAVQRALMSDTALAWKGRCERAGVPVGLIRTVPEALSDIGASAESGVPSSVGGESRRHPPRLGQHSAEIREFGWG